MSRESSHVAVLRDRASLMEAAAERIVGAARQAIASSGRFTWVLSGGSTPRRLYTLLASARFADSRVETFAAVRLQVPFFIRAGKCLPVTCTGWRIVAPILTSTAPPHAYQPGTWGPAEADRLIDRSGGWHDPQPAPTRRSS